MTDYNDNYVNGNRATQPMKDERERLKAALIKEFGFKNSHATIHYNLYSPQSRGSLIPKPSLTLDLRKVEPAIPLDAIDAFVEQYTADGNFLYTLTHRSPRKLLLVFRDEAGNIPSEVFAGTGVDVDFLSDTLRPTPRPEAVKAEPAPLPALPEPPSWMPDFAASHSWGQN